MRSRTIASARIGAVLLFPSLKVVGGHLIVGVRGRRVGDVDDDRGADQRSERNLIDRLASLREMHWRIDVRAAVLGREEVVRRVVVAGRRHAVGDLVVPERLRRRPEDGLRIVGVRQIDELARGKCMVVPVHLHRPG